MERYLKIVRKLKADQRAKIDRIWEKILTNDLSGLKIKKLKGFENYYSVRYGKIRIVFMKTGKINSIVNIDYRKNVYRTI